MLKKKTNEPLYMKRSKAAKQRELEEQEEYDNNYFMVNSNTRNLPGKETQHHRPQRKGRTHREIKYNYEDKFDERQYYDNDKSREMYEMETDVSQYTVDERRYRHRQPEIEFYESESECSDCSEECMPCARRRRRSSADRASADYTGYNGKRRPRHSRGWGSPKTRPVQPDFNDEWPYGRKNYYNVYSAHQPVNHRAFREDKTRDQHQSDTFFESETEMYDEETEGATEIDRHYENQTDNSTTYGHQYNDQTDYSRGYSPQYDQTEDTRVYSRQFRGEVKGTKGHYQGDRHYQKLPYDKGEYQVYAAHAEDNTAKVFDQPRRISYEREESLPVLAFLESPTSPKPTGSELIYLPVVVMDNVMQLPENRVMPPNELITNIGEEAEKPLETNIQVYAATHLEQGNIFQQVQQDSKAVNLANLQDISLYTVTQEEGHPLTQKKSGRSIVAKKTQSDSSTSINKYPVKKSYINVALSKVKSRSQSNNSLIGSTGQGRIRGSGFYSKVYKQDKQLREELKQKKNKIANENSSEIGLETEISIISLNEHDNEYQKEQEHITLKSMKSKDKNLNETVRDPQDTTAITRQSSANREAQVTNLKKDFSEESKAQERNKSIAKTKASNVSNVHNTSGRKSTPSKNKNTAENQQQILNTTRQSDTEENIYNPTNKQSNEAFSIKTSAKVKKPNEAIPKSNSLAVLRTNKAITEDQIDQDHGIQQSSPVHNITSKASLGNTAVKKKTTIMPSIFRRKKRAQPVPLETKTSSSSTHILNLDKTERHLNEPGNLNSMSSKEKTILRKTATGMDNKQSLPLIIWGYDCSYLVHLFQVLRIFLGLNMHATMLQTFNCFENDDDTSEMMMTTSS